jgi:hypothetical protein
VIAQLRGSGLPAAAALAARLAEAQLIGDKE